MFRFIDKHRDCFTVEFICQTLKNNREVGFITSRGYGQPKARDMSARRLRDVAIVERIRVVHTENYDTCGVRKMWQALYGEGIDVGREQTARLLCLTGSSGKGKGGAPRPTCKPKGPNLRPDLVNSEFPAPGLGNLWVQRYYVCANSFILGHGAKSSTWKSRCFSG